VIQKKNRSIPHRVTHGICVDAITIKRIGSSLIVGAF
jgi:hypothetical protein